MSTVNNLWGELPAIGLMRTPIAILREQATQLTELTNGLLEGEVLSGKATGNSLYIRLNIVAPALESYRFNVIFSTHDIMLYPIDLNDQVNGTLYKCEDEQQFVQAVAEILSSSAVHKVISALLSQSASEQVA